MLGQVLPAQTEFKVVGGLRKGIQFDSGLAPMKKDQKENKGDI